ncbi:hypothetical protein FBU30_006851 [Linnemannia zychae]|nr:hypothetical protein FBU30_006851 [Linnemannia zychae]
MEKIVYKANNTPGHHLPDVFIMTVPGMAEKYRAQHLHKNIGSQGNKSSNKHEPEVALVDVVESYKIYQTESGRGFEGAVSQPAKSDLDALFHTENQEAIIEQIIMNGEIQRRARS